jgi:hypothetical protein
MRQPLTLALFLLTTTLAHAQQSPWQGEWGAFTNPSASNGQRLTISDCTATTCTFSVSARAPGGNCGTASKATFTITSATEATATLPGESASQTCKLQLHRDPKSITVTATGNTCTSYYCTSPSITLSHTYPQRSTTPYLGLHADACLSNASPASVATCTDPALAKLEQQWQDLYADFPLTPDPKPNENGYSHAVAVDATILHQCDTAPNPATCLHDRFTADIALLNANQQAFIAGYTERGDPATASALAQKIAGRYRHSFANGDVQGDHYRSTDTLTITPVGRASIHFDAHLEFYNGHTCDLSGGALYRKNGSFVYDDKPDTANPTDPVCHLGIKPSATGVIFQDYTGGCKMRSCGERGGWNGASFTFAQRVPANKPSAK